MMLNGRISYLDYLPTKPFSEEFYSDICSKLQNSNVLLMRHHGIIAIGRTIEEAVLFALMSERAAKHQYISNSFGKMIDLDSNEFSGITNFLNQDDLILSSFNFLTADIDLI